MRPVRLEAEGFSAFRDRISVDFVDADFFALVGPTGSGKSSVLDAMCFALYGTVPRYEDARAVAPAITQGATEALVSLTFEVSGDEYVATRVVRRTSSGGASTKEARLERGDEVLAGTAKEVTEEVTELIGLTFDHFTRCVALPQGEFARFLHDTPGDRQGLLIKLLDLGIYGAMQRRANEITAESRNAIKLDLERLEDRADCTEVAEADARDALDEIKAFRKRLTDAAPAMQALEKEASALLHEADSVAEVLDLLGEVKVSATARKLASKREKAAQALADAEHERSKAERALDTATKAIADLPDAGTLQALLEAFDDRGNITTQIAELSAGLEKAMADAAESDEAVETAEHDEHQARHNYDAARDTAGAAGLRSSLVIGEPCPVCDHIVEVIPKRAGGDETKARKALDAASKTLESARSKAQEARSRVDRLKTQLEGAEKRLAEIDEKTAKATAKDVKAELADATKKRLERDKADAAFKRAVEAERAAGAGVAELDERVHEAGEAFQGQRDPLVAVGLKPPKLGADLLANWDALAKWAGEELSTQKDRARDVERRAKDKSAEASAQLSALVADAESSGIESDEVEPSLEELRELAAAAEADAKHELDRIATGRREVAKLEKRIAATQEEADVAGELASLLRSNNFEKWLINEALQRLVEAASETLEELSGNQYALAVNDRNEFEVIDYRNADERRSAKTLSGGETFQASLALALALAKQVSSLAVGGAARLDAIFLDEGFGTLDADALSTVAATLENLGSDGRMVGLITHVHELAELVPTRFEVAKGARTSTVTRVDA